VGKSIGRALALEPKLICFDEPTSALDPGLTDEVAKLIKSLSLTGMATLIITHDMDFAKKVADRIVSMDKGKLIEGLIFEQIN
jgi:polar amino acid transport system ATP-binding protein